LLLTVAAGCNRTPHAAPPSDQSEKKTEATVETDTPRKMTLSHRIEQPGFNVQAFQETPLYAKISGYANTWDPTTVDIGSRVRKGQVLAELYVPEMKVDLQQKDAALRQANAQVTVARAAVLTAEAQMERAKSQYMRLEKAGQGGVVGREDVAETHLGYKASLATVEKARADVTAAEANVEVARANRQFSWTMLQYARVVAPFDGVVTQRNVNLGDFVQPAGTGTKGQPLFVVSQVDPVRVFINVPGSDAPWVRDGDPVSLRLQGAGGERFEGKVTRTARSLDPQARTLRTEIDLPNPEGKLMPGTYVQARITVKHADVWTLPRAAVVTEGDQTYCYRVEDGKAIRTPLQVGLRGGKRLEVLKMEMRTPGSKEEGPWKEVTGEEKIVISNAASLSDGQAVRLARSHQ